MESKPVLFLGKVKFSYEADGKQVTETLRSLEVSDPFHLVGSAAKKRLVTDAMREIVVASDGKPFSVLSVEFEQITPMDVCTILSKEFAAGLYSEALETIQKLKDVAYWEVMR